MENSDQIILVVRFILYDLDPSARSNSDI